MSQPAPSNQQTGGQPASSEQSGTHVAALTMFGLLLVAYILMSADRYLMSALGVAIQKTLAFSDQQRGTLATIFTLGLGIGGIPSGWLIAKSSRKTVMIVGILIFSAATYLLTVAGDFYSMFATLVVQGFGMAMLATSMFALAGSYFSKSRVAALGAVNVCFGLGAVVAGKINPMLLSHYEASIGKELSWQPTIQSYAIFGVVLAVLIALAVRPWFSETRAIAKQSADVGGADSVKNRNTALLTVMSVFYGLTVYGFIGTYVSYLIHDLHYERPVAIDMLAWFGYGSLLSIFGGMLGDRLSPKLVIIGASLGVAILGYYVYLPDLSVDTRRALSFAFGIFGPAVLYTNLAGAHIKSMRRSLSRLGSSMFVTTLYAGGACGGFLISYLAGQSSWEHAARIQLSLLPLIGAVLALGLRPADMSK